MKFVFWIVGTLISLSVALTPEIIMWFLYDMIHPAGEIARVLVLLAFWIFGSGMCVGFGAIGVLLFISVTKAALEG